MTKPQSPVDMATEMLRDLEEFERSGGKEAFRKQLREEFVRRSGSRRSSGGCHHDFNSSSTPGTRDKMAIAETRHRLAQAQKIRPIAEGIATGALEGEQSGKTTGDHYERRQDYHPSDAH